MLRRVRDVLVWQYADESEFVVEVRHLSDGVFPRVVGLNCRTCFVRISRQSRVSAGVIVASVPEQQQLVVVFTTILPRERAHAESLINRDYNTGFPRGSSSILRACPERSPNLRSYLSWVR